MASSNSPNDTSDQPSREFTGALTQDERQALRERSEQARAAAAEAITNLTALFLRSRSQLDAMSRHREVIDATRAMLRESVERYAVLLRTLDTPPERVIRLVKETVAEQISHPELHDETGPIMENVVRWCIEAYYGSSPAA